MHDVYCTLSNLKSQISNLKSQIKWISYLSFREELLFIYRKFKVYLLHKDVAVSIIHISKHSYGQPSSGKNA